MENKAVYVNAPIRLADNEQFRVKGRYTVVNGCLAFDWCNSGFAFAFNGTGFIISLGKYESEQPAYVKVTIDGVRSQRFAVVNGQEKLIIESLPDKRHRVEVLKITESEAKLLFKTVELIGVGASLRNPPFESPRKIEFIGDSITCGYGVLGKATDEPAYYTYQQDSTRSYAYITAEKCTAEGRYISVSGKGIVCNCKGDRADVKAGQYYKYLTRLGGECNDNWIPDVVVINIGTNDSGGPAPDGEFSSAAKDLVYKVRARYPEAHIIWMYGMMSNLYAETLRNTMRELSAEDERVHFLFVESVAGNEPEIGANGHPNVRASVRAANLLYKKIHSVTGWKSSVVLEDSEN